MAESFIDTFKTELVADRPWRSRSELELAIVAWVGWFRGRDGHCWPPPAQIPACASNALGS
jgi:hypothetical protein